MKALLINQGHTANYGDIAIAKTVESQIKKMGHNTAIASYCDEAKVYGKLLNNKIFRKTILRPLFIKDIFNTRMAKKYINQEKPDIAIIGGGELLSSHVEFNTALYSWVKELRKHNIPVFLVGVSGDIDMSQRMLNRYRKALSYCKKVIVRDNKTRSNIKNAYGLATETYPDVVFSMFIPTKHRATKATLITLINPTQKIYSKLKITNKIDYFEYYYNQIPNKEQTIIVSPTVKNDERITREFADYIANKKHLDVICDDYTDLDDFLKRLDDCETVISARMHAMILALLKGCRIIPIEFKEKLITFAKEYAKDEIDINKIHDQSTKQFKALLK